MAGVRRVIGVDESGKGDFFGPLVVAALLASDSDKLKLLQIGVRDGKLIADKKLLTLDKQLRAEFTHAVVVYSPGQYNEQYAAIKNLNKLLAEGHARAIAAVLAKHRADLAISDKFGKTELVEEALRKRELSIKLRQVVRGEEIPQVAAASIIARAVFIREIDKLSRRYGIEIPRGAGFIVDQAGRELARRHSASVFSKIAKIHFKNYQRIVKTSLFT
ncbi:MAG: ribonuclease HIII [Candidatus Zixiibacteriota bacterium]